MYSHTNQFFYSAKEKVSRHFSVLFSSRAAYAYIISAILLQAVDWAFAWYIQSRLGAELLILHNNPYFGIDWIASSGQIFMIPAWSAAFLLLDFILSLILVKKNLGRFLANFLLATAVLASVFSLASLFFIYLINFH
jgi:hypothetical protein